jgi:hypothetical protein
MMRKFALVLSLIVLLPASSIAIAFGDIPLASTNVTYTVSGTASYDGRSIGQIGFDVNITLEFEANYTYLVDGDFPGSALCYLGVSPYSGTLTVNYQIYRPTMPDLNGSRLILMPQGGQELLGDSPPIAIPIDSSGTIETVIHGHLSGILSLDSRSPTSLEWSTWDIKIINITSNAPIALLVTTQYAVSFNVTVSMNDFDAVAENVPQKEVSGNPPEFVIPEIPSLIILPLFMMATLLAVTVYKRKRGVRQI